MSTPHSIGSMRVKLQPLARPEFLTGLGILLANDFLLKSWYGNFLTGKLSDFAGLFIFPLFWTALFPRHKTKIFILTALGFVYWKSPHSQLSIDAWNHLEIFRISRVIDYTDLIALTVLPLSFYAERKENRTRPAFHPLASLALSCFAFIATSKAPRTCFNDEGIYHVKHISRDSLISDMKKLDLDIRFIPYNDEKYPDRHAEINNLDDSIRNIVVLVEDYNEKDHTVEIRLGCWHHVTDTASTEPGNRELERQKNYIRKAFEQKVIQRIEKNIP